MNNSKSTESDVYYRCITLLSRREYSVLELQQKMTRDSISDEMIEIVINRLIADNYQSDERFAEMFCRSRVRRKHGPRKIRYELQQKGISDALINQELPQYSDDILNNAAALIKRKAPRGDIDALLNDFIIKQKVSKSLAPKGYEFDTIKQAFAVLKEEYL